MLQTIINTTITIIVSSLLGFCISKMKEYKKTLEEKTENEKLQNIAIKSMLKSSLTKTFYVYNEINKIPDYVYEDFIEMLEVYESFGGDGYIHTLAKKMESWEIIKTDILK